jgi:hypothetical protein
VAASETDVMTLGVVVYRRLDYSLQGQPFPVTAYRYIIPEKANSMIILKKYFRNYYGFYFSVFKGALINNEVRIFGGREGRFWL